MNKPIQVSWTPDEFTPVGVLDVTPEALEIARAVVAEGRRVLPGKDWVASFGWHDWQEATFSDPSIDTGPGTDIGAHERHEIPPDRIATVNGFEFAIQIPKEVCEAATERVIDRVDENSTKVVLK